MRTERNTLEKEREVLASSHADEWLKITRQYQSANEHVLAAKAAVAAIEQLQDITNQLAEIGTHSVAQLRLEGWSLGELAKQLGISRERVRQLGG